jgi:dihydrofolate reductase
MRKVVYGGACSLDGFFAGPQGELDWLHFSKDVQSVMAASWASTDTLLFGRRTWEYAVSQGGGGDRMRGVKSYVFSRTLTGIDRPDVELIGDDAGAFVRALKTQPGKDMLVMSGGNLAQSLLDAGVVDEIGLNVHPLLLGGGVPAFLSTNRRVTLELKENRTMDGGCVLLRYTVKHGTA